MNIKKIADVAEAQQTDELKLLIYRQIQQFVYKYQPRYYPSYSGDINDLALNIFEEFCRKKKHRNGEVFSELDRMDPSVVGNGQWTGDERKAIATYTQRFVTHSLIDAARLDKHEVTASENYDERHAGLTLDRAVSGQRKQSAGDDGMVGGAYVENINNTFYDLMENEVALANAEKAMKVNPDKAKYILRLVKHYGDRLDPEVKEFAEKLASKYAPVEQKKSKAMPKFDEEAVKALTGANIVKQPLQNRPALKLEFATRDELNAVDLDKLNSLLDPFEFYTKRGNNLYYFVK